jgi:flagellar biogenesis protein FliO
MMVGYICRIFPGIFISLYFATIIGLIIYFAWLAIRFVRAVERIADKFESSRAPTES